MVIRDGKIVECTDEELFDYWIKRLDDAYPYEQFKFGCVMNGTKIVEEVRAGER